jgi:ABC-type sugar transport system ATPase subunit
VATSVELAGITKAYRNGVLALDAIDLRVEAGEKLAIVGPSGSGKSTLLRVVAGLESPGRGAVILGGRDVTRRPPEDRDLAMVFQQPAVYPFLDVFGNLAFGLRARRHDRQSIRRRVGTLAERLGLAGLLRRRPDELSGGQRQRVALGRALARRPSVLLLDEPFSALDAPLRAALRGELLDLQRDEGVTCLHVTHDQAEALAFGDRVAVLFEGRLLQVGTPDEVYRAPAHVRVAEFLGSPPMNCIPVGLEVGPDRVRVTAPGLEFSAARGAPWLPASLPYPRGEAILGLRPESIELADASSPGEAAGRAFAGARVDRLEPRGHETIATLRLAGPPIQVRLRPGESALRPGDPATIRLDLTRAAWFDAATGDRLAGAAEAPPAVPPGRS